MALKPNSLLVFNYVKENDGKDFTANDIAEATGLTSKQVNGIITSAFQKKGLMIREEVAVTGGKVKYIRLTDEGKDFDPEAPDAE
jgi:DNA-binding MarR family transcriptional regulator